MEQQRLMSAMLKARIVKQDKEGEIAKINMHQAEAGGDSSDDEDWNALDRRHWPSYPDSHESWSKPAKLGSSRPSTASRPGTASRPNTAQRPGTANAAMGGGVGTPGMKTLRMVKDNPPVTEAASPPKKVWSAGGGSGVRGQHNAGIVKVTPVRPSSSRVQ